MKRRRWWFVGLALALLAVFVFAWKWSERPPYKFMEGAVITDLFVGGGSTVIEFRSSKGIRALKARADAEMISMGWEKSSLSSPEYGREACDYIRPCEGDSSRADHVWLSERQAKGTLVTVQRLTAPFDHLRGWLFNLRVGAP